DYEIDAVEQPNRPIPSGRISLLAATRVGWGMLLLGVTLAWVVTFRAEDWRAGVVASILATVILLYDGAIKKSRFAPLLMGECRFLNVLLGMSLSPILWGKAEVLIAGGIGVYIIGVTIFSRTDSRRSERRQLGLGFVILSAGIALLAFLPRLTG